MDLVKQDISLSLRFTIHCGLWGYRYRQTLSNIGATFSFHLAEKLTENNVKIMVVDNITSRIIGVVLLL
jgi:hypothetical protein